MPRQFTLTIDSREDAQDLRALLETDREKHAGNKEWCHVVECWLDELDNQLDVLTDEEREEEQARADAAQADLDDQAAAADDEAIRAGTYPMDRG